MREVKLYTATEFLAEVGYEEDDDIDFLGLLTGTATLTEEEEAEAQEWIAKDRAYMEARETELREANKYKPCPKCGGRGVIDAYWKIKNGQCFKCGGTGKVLK